MTFFELSLRKHNYLSFNRVFEDMRNEVVDFHSICLGPFPSQFTKLELIISYMKKDTIEPIFSYTEWVRRHLENQIEGDEDENSLINLVKEWRQIKVRDRNGVESSQWFLIFNLHRLEQKVWGDFKVQFKSDQASFYFWLNVSAILYNEELRQATENSGLDDPIHFDEFQEIEETDFRSDKLNMYNLLLPESHAGIVHTLEEEDKNPILNGSDHMMITQ